MCPSVPKVETHDSSIKILCLPGSGKAIWLARVNSPRWKRMKVMSSGESGIKIIPKYTNVLKLD